MLILRRLVQGYHTSDIYFVVRERDVAESGRFVTLFDLCQIGRNVFLFSFVCNAEVLL